MPLSGSTCLAGDNATITTITITELLLPLIFFVLSVVRSLQQHAGGRNDNATLYDRPHI